MHPYADVDSSDTMLRAYKQMIRLREMDSILQNAQRQGRISFYMTCHGEEAIHIGSASALEAQDVVLAQYRYETSGIRLHKCTFAFYSFYNP